MRNADQPSGTGEPRKAKCAWFTDTIDDLNGVARTVRTMSAAAERMGYDLTVVTCRPDGDVVVTNRKNFTPVAKFALPKYPLQTVTLPPLRALYAFIKRERFDRIIISTPGPVGLAALMVAKMLRIRTIGIDHTDFPQYIRFLTGNEMLASLGTGAMRLIYGRFDTVFVNSEFYRRRWLDQGFKAEKLHILPRGLDTVLFNYHRREENFWRERGAKHKVLLYVGRVSKEKELEFLTKIFSELRTKGVPVDLAIVGEGPYREEMQKKIPYAIFTGALNGDELGTAYASADLFMFPSTTDTFGNVVIEATASGLPVFVSDVGGPKELINGSLGKVLPAGNLEQWVSAVQDWLTNSTTRDTLIANAEQVIRERNWDKAFEEFWTLTVN